jgi:tetratricopeptide (TPR) repeat protein
MGAPRALALCFNFGGALDFQEGHWDTAEKNLRDAVLLYRQIGSASGESLSLQRLGVLLTARGRLDEALQNLEDGIIVAERSAMRSHCLTRLHASMLRNRMAAGDRRGLEPSLGEAKESARRHGKCVTCNALLLPEMVRAHIALDDLEAAEASLRALQATAAEFDSRVWTAMAAQAEGRVLHARGRNEGAAASLERAREAFQASEQPYEAARCLASMAVCTRDPAQRERLRSAAQAVFSRLGAPGTEDFPLSKP